MLSHNTKHYKPPQSKSPSTFLDPGSTQRSLVPYSHVFPLDQLYMHNESAPTRHYQIMIEQGQRQQQWWHQRRAAACFRSGGRIQQRRQALADVYRSSDAAAVFKRSLLGLVLAMKRHKGHNGLKSILKYVHCTGSVSHGELFFF